MLHFICIWYCVKGVKRKEAIFQHFTVYKKRKEKKKQTQRQHQSPHSQTPVQLSRPRCLSGLYLHISWNLQPTFKLILMDSALWGKFGCKQKQLQKSLLPFGPWAPKRCSVIPQTLEHLPGNLVQVTFLFIPIFTVVSAAAAKSLQSM